MQTFKHWLLVFVIAIMPVAAKAQEWHVNFNNAQISELVKFVADKTGLTIVVDPQVKGKVKVISSKPVDEEELYALFLSILEVHGFAAVKSGDVLRVVPTKDARSLPVPTSGGKGAEIVTQVMHLKNVAAAKLIPILRPMVPQQAHMAAYAPSNSIIISDTAENIARLRQVIEGMDRSADTTTSIVKLQHASADEVVRLLEGLEKANGGKDASASRVGLVADNRTNSILVNGDRSERARVRALISHLDAPLHKAGNARVIYLRYARAKDLAETLNKVAQNIEKAGKGKNPKARNENNTSIEADEATNSLIITAPPAIMQNLETLVARLDIRRAQVLVEAIIVELNAIDNRNLGVQWIFSNDNAGFGSFSNGANDGGSLGRIGGAALDNGQDTTTTTIDPQTGQTTTTTVPDDSLVNFAGALAGTVGQTLGIGKINENGTSFAVLLQALKEDQEANVLSTPSIMTLDNSEASLSVGQNVPFVTGSFTNASGAGANNPFQTIQRENVGIELKVTPHINEGDSVILEIEQEVSSLTGLEASDIITNERKISATVLAQDGDTIVLGGLIKDDVQETIRKVPVLGDIPGLGRLFRSNGTNINKTNLYVFLRPTIIRTDADMTGATAEKYRYIRNQQLAKKERGVDLVDDDQLPLLPEWEEQLKKLKEQSTEQRFEVE
jgi:general secretion pathway protein D